MFVLCVGAASMASEINFYSTSSFPAAGSAERRTSPHRPRLVSRPPLDLNLCSYWDIFLIFMAIFGFQNVYSAYICDSAIPSQPICGWTRNGRIVQYFNTFVSNDSVSFLVVRMLGVFRRWRMRHGDVREERVSVEKACRHHHRVLLRKSLRAWVIFTHNHKDYTVIIKVSTVTL